MISLTEYAYYTRKTINYGIIGLIVVIILRIIWTVSAAAWIAAHPAPPPPPNMAFGKLPAPVFPDSGKNYSLDFKLETISGNFPESSPSARVYFMPIANANLLGLDRASEKAKKMGFNKAPLTVSREEYLWTDELNPLRTLKINVVNGNLTLRYDYHQDQTVYQAKDLPLADAAINEAKDTLQNYDLLRDDLAVGDTKVTNLKEVGGILTEVSGVSDANFVRVQFLRSAFDKMNVLTPSLEEAPTSLTFSGSRDAVKRVAALDYKYQMIDPENSATYPIKTPQTAWDELKRGAGYVAGKPKSGGKTVTVRNIYLAYYDSLMLQTYLEPVYVFDGDDNFRAYIPAVNSQWLGQ